MARKTLLKKFLELDSTGKSLILNFIYVGPVYYLNSQNFLGFGVDRQFIDIGDLVNDFIRYRNVITSALIIGQSETLTKSINLRHCLNPLYEGTYYLVLT